VRTLSAVFKHVKRLATGRLMVALSLGIVLGASFVGISVYAVHETSQDAFCLSCHEMTYVEHRGWIHSSHRYGTLGVRAQCQDCHIPPGFWPTMWTKIRDGSKDVYVHTFGQADPAKMDWRHLRHVARRKVSDSACRRCHTNLVARGLGLQAIMAHRQYLRGLGKKRCVDCHNNDVRGASDPALVQTKNIGGSR